MNTNADRKLYVARIFVRIRARFDIHKTRLKPAGQSYF